MKAIHCSNCHRPYPDQGVPYRCPTCGGIFDFAGPLVFEPSQVDETQPGIWRYRHTFGLPEDAPVVSLGEGNTPLVWAEAFGRQVAFKLDYLNPSGSFKDRGTAPLTSFLVARGVKAAVEDSSGNAGASFAAYAAFTNIQAQIFVPDYASGPKRKQIEAYGAEVTPIPGPRSAAAEAVLHAAGEGAVYASHAYLPHGTPGYATVAYELVDQLGQAPGAVIAPAGHGSYLLGAGRGFEALKAAGLIDRVPALVGVQARACAPLWSVFSHGPMGLEMVMEGETLAEGVRVRQPMRGDALLPVVESSGGTFFAVEEDEILHGHQQLATRGLYVEPTSAIVWPAIEHAIANDVPDPIVVLLSGFGLKSSA